MTALVTTLIVLSVVILTSLFAGAIFLLRKYSSSRGDYYTQVHKYFQTNLHIQDDINPHDQEDEGDKLAGDADTAVLKAKTGSQVKMRREWFI